MIFPKQTLGLILDGRTTTDLRPIVPGAPAPEGLHQIRRRGGKSLEHAGRIVYIRILNARVVELDTITEAEARAAGFVDLATYRDEWCRTHWTGWTEESAWLIDFHIEPPRERPLFLNRRRKPSVGEDYTSSSRRAIDDLEAVHPSEVAQLTAAADKRWRERCEKQDAVYAELPLAARLAMYQRDAKEGHVNISPEERVIARALDRIAQKTRRAA